MHWCSAGPAALGEKDVTYFHTYPHSHEVSNAG
jgi:hypothetical protein